MTTASVDQGRVDPEEWRRFVYEVAKAVASGWERWRAYIEKSVAPVREWILRELAPRPGDTVLELAAGAGDTGFEAAAIVGKRGRVISTDVSPEMVEVARRRGAELGLQNVDYRVMDAPTDGSFRRRQATQGSAMERWLAGQRAAKTALVLEARL